MEKRPLVLIQWEDSRQPLSEWRHLDGLELPEVSACTTVGWLLKDEKHRKVIAQTLGGLGDNDNPQATGIMVIPARCVIAINRIGVPTSASSDNKALRQLSYLFIR